MLLQAGIAVGVLATLFVTVTTAHLCSSFVLEKLRAHPREVSGWSRRTTASRSRSAPEPRGARRIPAMCCARLVRTADNRSDVSERHQRRLADDILDHVGRARRFDRRASASLKTSSMLAMERANESVRRD